jgi:hypothetical protein
MPLLVLQIPKSARIFGRGPIFHAGDSGSGMKAVPGGDAPVRPRLRGAAENNEERS